MKSRQGILIHPQRGPWFGPDRFISLTMAYLNWWSHLCFVLKSWEKHDLKVDSLRGPSNQNSDKQASWKGKKYIGHWLLSTFPSSSKTPTSPPATHSGALSASVSTSLTLSLKHEPNWLHSPSSPSTVHATPSLPKTTLPSPLTKPLKSSSFDEEILLYMEFSFCPIAHCNREWQASGAILLPTACPAAKATMDSVRTLNCIFRTFRSSSC